MDTTRTPLDREIWPVLLALLLVRLLLTYLPAFVLLLAEMTDGA